jgi:hypothetical protein
MRLFMHPWEITGYICVFGSYRKFLNNWNVEYHFFPLEELFFRKSGGVSPYLMHLIIMFTA